MSKKLLKEVLGHALVSQVLRHRMTQEVRVDVLGYPCLDRHRLALFDGRDGADRGAAHVGVDAIGTDQPR